jgi:hypothetical protein
MSQQELRDAAASLSSACATDITALNNATLAQITPSIIRSSLVTLLTRIKAVADLLGTEVSAIPPAPPFDLTAPLPQEPGA